VLDKKNKESVAELRNKIVEKLKEWLGEDIRDNIFYAIAIEQIDAWVLTIYSNIKETAYKRDPKNELKKMLKAIAIESINNEKITDA